MTVSPSGSRSFKGDLVVAIGLVEYGYQIDIYNYTLASDDGNGVIHSMQCRDFSRSYDVAKIAHAMAEAVLKAVRNVERTTLRPNDELSDRHANNP